MTQKAVYGACKDLLLRKAQEFDYLTWDDLRSLRHHNQRFTDATLRDNLNKLVKTGDLVRVDRGMFMLHTKALSPLKWVARFEPKAFDVLGLILGRANVGFKSSEVRAECARKRVSATTQQVARALAIGVAKGLLRKTSEKYYTATEQGRRLWMAEME